MRRAGPLQGSDVVPADASPFHAVTQAIRRKGRPHGWQKARDVILDNFPAFEGRWGGYQALKAALEIDRHAMFAEVQAVAAEGRFKREVWEEWQKYMRGEIAKPPVTGPTRLDADGIDAHDGTLDEEADE